MTTVDTKEVKPWRMNDQSAGTWRRVRDRIFHRDLGRCQPCLKIGKFSRAMKIEHIKPIAHGGGDEDANLWVVCRRCHVVGLQRAALPTQVGE